MARFRGTVRGRKAAVSRLGDKGSGLVTECNGWHMGVRVEASVTPNGDDYFVVYLTCGSMGEGERQVVGTFRCAEPLVKEEGPGADEG